MKFKVFLTFVENITLRLIHLKHYYPYLFAHKPLCDKFKTDSISIKNIYLCRSCFFLYSGLIFAFILYHFLSLNYITLLISLFIIILFSNPIYYRFYSRPIRDFSRFFLGFLATLFLLKTYNYDKMFFAYSFICLLIIKHLYNIQRQKVDLCKNCQELLTNKICSGYALQTNAMLQIEEEMSNYIMRRRRRFNND